MKYIILLFFVGCMGILHPLENGVWYIYNFQEQKCQEAVLSDGTDIGPSNLINEPNCFTEKINVEEGLVIINCTQEPRLRGNLYFSKTMKACEKYFQSKDHII